jgi:hypothetical protein
MKKRKIYKIGIMCGGSLKYFRAINPLTAFKRYVKAHKGALGVLTMIVEPDHTSYVSTASYLRQAKIKVYKNLEV